MIKEIQEYMDEIRSNFKYYKSLAVRHKEACALCKEVVPIWANKKGRTCDLHISNNYIGVNLDLHLAKDDTIEKDVNLFIESFEDIALSEGYSQVEINEHVPGRWIRYHYALGSENIHILFFYGLAEACKVVGSGKFEEVLKRVCD